MSNAYRMVNIEFFGSFLYSCKRISFDDCFQLVVVSFWWPAAVLLISQALISFAKLLEPPLHCVFISSSWARCLVMLPVVSAALSLIFELEEENDLNLFFV